MRLERKLYNKQVNYEPSRRAQQSCAGYLGITFTLGLQNIAGAKMAERNYLIRWSALTTRSISKVVFLLRHRRQLDHCALR